MQENNMYIEEIEEKNFWQRVKKHRKKIAIASATACVAIAGIIIYKKCSAVNVFVNKEGIIKELNTLKDELPMFPENANNDNTLINVSVPEHRRRLHEGQKHSQAKAELAALLGYNLPENETIVNPYSYQRKSA